MRNRTCFQHQDLANELPPPGWYASTITSARFRSSANGNRMLQVSHHLEGVASACDQVADYFVLEGASERGVITARRRLVRLYRACGLEPQEGEEIRPAMLCLGQLEIKVEHDEWESQARLRAVAYRAAHSGDAVPL